MRAMPAPARSGNWQNPGRMDSRLAALEQWLAGELNGVACRLAPASEDASFRRYFRAHLQDGRTYIVMDAPPPQEDCAPFVRIAHLLREAGLHAPEVHAQDLARGFLLLSDLGTRTYLAELNEASAGHLFADATDALIAWQLASRPGELLIVLRLLPGLSCKKSKVQIHPA